MGLWRSYRYEMFRHRMDNVENKNRELEKRVDELEATIHLKDKIITATHASRMTIEPKGELSNAELVRVFDLIREAVVDGQRKLILYKYDNWVVSSDDRCWHVEQLAEELQKYGYQVKITKMKNTLNNKRLRISWKKRDK